MIDLASAIADCYSMSELKTLCYELGVKYDDLPGDGLEDKARELVQYLDRRGNLRALAGQVALERPHAIWRYQKASQSSAANLPAGVLDNGGREYRGVMLDLLDRVDQKIDRLGENIEGRMGRLERRQDRIVAVVVCLVLSLVFFVGFV